MSDVFTAEKRSHIMSRIKSADTRPELVVKKLLRSIGFHFSYRTNNLPGVPDIVNSKFHVAIFVHGCFWHGHSGCRYFKLPASNQEFWKQKIEGNIERDLRKTKELLSNGWKVATLWECQLIKDAPFSFKDLEDQIRRKIQK